MSDHLQREIAAALAVDLSPILTDVHAFLGRYVAYPSDDAQVAHTLWIAHAHAIDAWDSTPRIAFLSPEPGSGKTRALEVTEPLVPRPVESVNATPAYLFRKIADPEGPPTLLYDEIDTVFGPKAKDNEEIRGVLNAGHRKGAKAGRCVVRGKTVETEELDAYCAVALAGLGRLPDTILTRSVVVRMRRRAPAERIEPYRRREVAPEAHALRDRLAEWGQGFRLAGWPAMPDGVEDRAADVWEALLAVADAAGGDWPGLARVAAVALVALPMGEAPSLGVRLLADLRQVFDEPVLATVSLLERLNGLEEAPWGNLRGNPLGARDLARFLGDYEVQSRNVKVEGKVLRGYRREDLHDPWTRYLPPLGPSPKESATSATSATEGGAR